MANGHTKHPETQSPPLDGSSVYWLLREVEKLYSQDRKVEDRILKLEGRVSMIVGIFIAVQTLWVALGAVLLSHLLKGVD